MYIKLLGENENGFPLDCTVGKVYEIAVEGVFNKDNSYQYMAYLSKVGQWQVVDKNGKCY